MLLVAAVTAIDVVAVAPVVDAADAVDAVVAVDAVAAAFVEYTSSSSLREFRLLSGYQLIVSRLWGLKCASGDGPGGPKTHFSAQAQRLVLSASGASTRERRQVAKPRACRTSQNKPLCESRQKT